MYSSDTLCCACLPGFSFVWVRCCLDMHVCIIEPLTTNTICSSLAVRVPGGVWFWSFAALRVNYARSANAAVFALSQWMPPRQRHLANTRCRAAGLHCSSSFIKAPCLVRLHARHLIGRPSSSIGSGLTLHELLSRLAFWGQSFLSLIL
jgi:hypothetical protein